MPVLGFGTWEITGKACIDSVESALNQGYRHIDTAQVYGNEEEVGRGIQQSEVDREAIFLTTKIDKTKNKPSAIKESLQDSLSRLRTDYVDLLLIHWPTTDMNLEACLETMLELKEKDLIRNLGVSNFRSDLFKRALDTAPVFTNQVKFTPENPQFENLEVAKKFSSSLTAYSPLERGDISEDAVLGKIGNKYNKSASQVSLRWLIQLGDISVIPKAQSAKHRKENMEIFDFELSDEDMQEIMNLKNQKKQISE